MKRYLIFWLLIWQTVANAQNIDIRILRAINSPEPLPSDGFFKFISNTNTYVIIGTPAVLAVTGFIKDDREMVRNAVVMIAGKVVNQGITLALKYSINRERPFDTYPDIVKKISVSSPSFPSGHTSSAFAAATSLTLAYPKWYVIVPSYAWAGTVGYSRMHLGVHYPSDVLAGAVVGAGSAILTYELNKLLQPKKKRIKPCDCPK